MIKVDCPSCQASYDLDERRVPSKGMKMRCPKCSASFHVQKNGETTEGPAVSVPPPPVAPPKAPTGPAIGTPKGAGLPTQTLFGGAAPPPPAAPLPSAASAAPKPQPAPKPQAPVSNSSDEGPAAARGPNLGGHARPAGAFFNPTATLVGTRSPLSPAIPEPAPERAAPQPPPPSAPPAVAKAAPATTPPSAGAFGGSKKPAGAFGSAGAFGGARKATVVGGLSGPKAAAPAPSLNFGTSSPGDESELDLPAVAKSVPPPMAFGAKGSAPNVDADLPAPRPAPVAPPFPAGVSQPPPKPAPIAPPFSPKSEAKPAPIAPPFSPKPEAKPAPIAPPFSPKSEAKPAPIAPPFSPKQTPEDAEIDLPAFKGVSGASEPFPAIEPGPAELPGFGLEESSGSESEIELDLPVVRGTGGDEMEIDLPAVRGAGGDEMELDLPAVRGAGSHEMEIDLPAPLHGTEGGTDLPAPRGQMEDELDLPAPVGEQGFGEIGLDLPAPKGAAEEDPFGSIDLPALSDLQGGHSDPELPQPAFGSDEPQIDLPVARGNADLPAIAEDNVDLPGPTGEMDVPGLPGFGDLDLMLPEEPRAASSRPAPGPSDDPFGDLELPAPRPSADMVTPRERTVQGVGAPRDGEGESELPPSLFSDDEASFGDIDLGDGEEFGSAGLPEPPSSDSPLLNGLSMPPMAAAGEEAGELPEEADFGEEDFVSEDEEELYDDEEDMEFGIDDDEDRGFSLPPEVLRRRSGKELEEEQGKKGNKALKTLVAAVAVAGVMGVGGVALGMFSPYGYFGIYYIEQFLPEAASPEFARGEIDRAEQTAQLDGYDDARKALTMLGNARGKAGLNRELLTRSLMHSAYFILRYGESPETATHAAAIRRRLAERSDDAKGIELALAADLAREGKWAEAKAKLAAAEKLTPTDTYVHLLRGEIALAEGEGKAAETAFAKALTHKGGARAHYGLARAARMLDDKDALSRELDAALQENPKHEEALIDRAVLRWTEGDPEGALADLRAGVGDAPVAGKTYLRPSRRTKARGLAMLGYLQERSGQLHEAREAYDQALSTNPTLLEALLGAGRVMIRERRFADAVTRFNSATAVADKEGNPTVLSGRKAKAEARLGAARALLSLERAPEARTILAELATELPDDHQVALTLGDAYAELNDPVQAEGQYTRAIELAPDAFDGYLALSQLFAKRGRADKASEVLNEATSKVEETSEMRRMLGYAELSRNHLRGAIHEFERALEIAPKDLEARYGLGKALRRSGQLDEARTAFDTIAQTDPAFAGLALERGLLHESVGHYDEAIETYREALEHQPNDLDLLLRLGAAQVQAKRFDDAEQTLDRVIAEVPNSAQAEYLVGRVAFGRGRTPDALTHFDRALGLDGSQGEFRLYAARASLEMGNLGRALEEAQLAIERDPSLGDSFWVRGIVRQRMGAVQDALRDFQRAIKLNPNRVDAFAGMGDCLEQMGQLNAAIDAYNTALRRSPERGDWWYRLGQLTQDRGRRAEAARLVDKAIALGDDHADSPYWLADAYRMAGDLARTSGNRKKATASYLRYLDVANDGHLDRTTVQGHLRKWGVNWKRDEDF